MNPVNKYHLVRFIFYGRQLIKVFFTEIPYEDAQNLCILCLDSIITSVTSHNFPMSVHTGYKWVSMCMCVYKIYIIAVFNKKAESIKANISIEMINHTMYGAKPTVS